jgi:Zn-dependent protease with chaperone function
VAGLRVIAEQLPVAYCLPGLRQSRVVLSAGTLAMLDAQEIAAVLAHEAAHVRARHDIVLDTFVALQRAFPHAIRSDLPVQQCRLLVEMLADDAARRRAGPEPLARALVALAGSTAPGGALGLVGSGLSERLDRLTGAVPGWAPLLAGAVYALAAALVVGPIALIGITRLLG